MSLSCFFFGCCCRFSTRNLMALDQLRDSVSLSSSRSWDHLLCHLPPSFALVFFSSSFPHPLPDTEVIVIRLLACWLLQEIERERESCPAIRDEDRTLATHLLFILTACESTVTFMSQSMHVNAFARRYSVLVSL